MNDLILIPVSKHEFKEIIRNCIIETFKEHANKTAESFISDELMSTQEASKFLNLAKQTIYGLTSKNVIPHIKRGKKLYFSKTELANWLKEGKQKTVSEYIEQAKKY